MKAYLAAKPKDIRFPQTSDLTDTPPFVTAPNEDATMADAAEPSIDWSAKCPVFEAVGECSQGLKCRFLGGHARKGENGEIVLIVDEERKAREIIAHTEVNFVTGETLKAIRSKKVRRHLSLGVLFAHLFQFPHPIADAYLKELQETQANENTAKTQKAPTEPTLAAAEKEAVEKPPVSSEAPLEAVPQLSTAAPEQNAAEDLSQVDTPDVPMRPSEKKRLHWTGKTCTCPTSFDCIILGNRNPKCHLVLSAQLSTMSGLVC